VTTSDHRDFVLSLDPTLVYLLSQVWISVEKRDGTQSKYCLRKLANNKVGTEDRKRAAMLWQPVVDTSPTPTADSVRGSAGQLGRAASQTDRRSARGSVRGLPRAHADVDRSLNGRRGEPKRTH